VVLSKYELGGYGGPKEMAMIDLAEHGGPLIGGELARRSERPLAIALVTIIFGWSLVFAVTLIAGRPADSTTQLLRAAATIPAQVQAVK
jgi:hypothetical protein